MRREISSLRLLWNLHSYIQKPTGCKMTVHAMTWQTCMRSHWVPCWVCRSCVLMSSMWLVIHCSLSLHSISSVLSREHRCTCSKVKKPILHRRHCCTGHRKPNVTNWRDTLEYRKIESDEKIYTEKWPHRFSCSAAMMWLTSLWSWACSTCFWLSNSSSSSLRAFCNLCSSICRASCSLDGLAKSARRVISVRTRSKSFVFSPHIYRVSMYSQGEIKKSTLWDVALI